MAQGVKTLVAESDNLSSIPGPNPHWRNNRPTNQPHTHTQNVILKIIKGDIFGANVTDDEDWLWIDNHKEMP